MPPHPRAIDRARWQPRCFVLESDVVIPPQRIDSRNAATTAILVDLILTRILFLAQTAPGRFDK